MSLKLYKSIRGTLILGEVETDECISGVAISGRNSGYAHGWNKRSFNIYNDHHEIIIDNSKFFLIREDLLYVKKSYRDQFCFRYYTSIQPYADCFIDLKNKILMPCNARNNIPKKHYKKGLGKKIIFKNE